MGIGDYSPTKEEEDEVQLRDAHINKNAGYCEGGSIVGAAGLGTVFGVSALMWNADVNPMAFRVLLALTALSWLVFCLCVIPCKQQGEWKLGGTVYRICFMRCCYDYQKKWNEQGRDRYGEAWNANS